MAGRRAVEQGMHHPAGAEQVRVDDQAHARLGGLGQRPDPQTPANVTTPSIPSAGACSAAAITLAMSVTSTIPSGI